MKNAIKNIWKIICYPLMYLGVQIVVSFIYIFAVGIAFAVKHIFDNAISGGDLMFGSFDNFDNIEELIMSWVDIRIPVILSSVICFLIVWLIIRKQWKADKFWSAGNLRISPPLLCISLGAALNVLTICILSMIPIAQQPQPFDDIIGNNFIIDFIMVALLAPVVEEIIFRGIVQKRLTKMMNARSAVFLQALIFGIVHLNLLQGVYAFVLGMIIGYIYHWFDSIWVAVILHIAFNGTSIALFYIFGDSDINLFYFLAIAAVVFIFSMASLVAMAERVKKHEERESSITFYDNVDPY